MPPRLCPNTVPTTPVVSTLAIETGAICPHPWPRLVCPLCGPAAEPNLTGRMAHSADAATVAVLVQQALRLHPQSVVLRGGETLLREEALQILAMVRAGSVVQLAVWTAGPLLARPGLADAVRSAGATDVAVVLFGETAAGHDYVAQTPGHFQRTLAGVQLARRAGLRVQAVVPVLRPSFRGLSALVQKAVPAGIGALRFWVPPGPDRPDHPLLAPLPMVAPYLQAALHLARTANLVVQVDGVPACQLGLHASLADAAHAAIAASSPADDPPEFGSPCGACTWGSRCVGVPASRVKAHGWVGVAARSDPPASANLPALVPAGAVKSD